MSGSFPLNMSPRFILIVFCVPQTRPLQGSPIQMPGGALDGVRQGQAQGCRRSSHWLLWAQHQTSGTWTTVRSLLGDQAHVTELKLLQALVL